MKISVTALILAVFFAGWPQVPFVAFLKIPQAYAQTEYDTVSESHTGTTGSVNEAFFGWTHAPIGTPRGVIVFVNSISGSDLSTSVDYGGVAMARVTASTATDSNTEPGTVTAWFLGSGIPTGSQTVTVNRTNNASTVYAVAITITGDSDTQIVGTPAILQPDGAYASQSVDTGSQTARRFAAGYYGGSNVLPADTGSVSTGASGQIDYGLFTFTTARESNGGIGARKVGFLNVTSDDRAAVHLAVADDDSHSLSYDTVSESHTGTTGSASEASFSWTHTPLFTPNGVLVFVNTIAAADLTTSVTYGGVTMTQVPGATAADTATELGTVSTWFLGSGIPTGAQSVVVNRTNNATVMYAAALSVTTNGLDTQISGTPVLLQENGAYAAQAVDSGSDYALRFAAGYYGGAAVLPADTGSVSTGASGQIDFGAFTFTTAIESTSGAGSRNVGFLNVTADDRAAVHVAIAELAELPATPVRTMHLFAGFVLKFLNGRIKLYGM